MKLAEFRTRSFSTREFWQAGLKEAGQAENLNFHYVEDYEASNVAETIDSDGLYTPPRLVMKCSLWDDGRVPCPATITAERQKDGQWITAREKNCHSAHVLKKLNHRKYDGGSSSSDEDAIISIAPPHKRAKYLAGGPVRCVTEFKPPKYERFSCVSKQSDHSSDRPRLAFRDPYDYDRRPRYDRKRSYSPRDRYRSRSPPPRRPYSREEDYPPRRGRDDRYDDRRENRGRRRERSSSRGRSYSRSGSRDRRVRDKRERDYDERPIDDRRRDRWPHDRPDSPLYETERPVIIGLETPTLQEEARRSSPSPNDWISFDSAYPLPDPGAPFVSRPALPQPVHTSMPGTVADIASASGFSSEITIREGFPTKLPWNSVPGAQHSAKLPAVFRRKNTDMQQAGVNSTTTDSSACILPQLNAIFDSKDEFEKACQAGVPPGSNWMLKNITNTANACEKSCRHLDMHRACTGSNFRIKCERNARDVWRVTKATFLHDNGASAAKANVQRPRPSYKVVSRPIPQPTFSISDAESQPASSVVTPPTDISAAHSSPKISILTHPPPAPIAGPSKLPSKSPASSAKSSAKGKCRAVIKDSDEDECSSSLSEAESESAESDIEAGTGKSLDLSTPASPKRSAAARKTTGSKQTAFAKKSTKSRNKKTAEEEEILRPSVPWLDNTAPPSRRSMLKVKATPSSRLMLPNATSSQANSSSDSQLSPPTLPIKAKSRPASPMNLDDSADERRHSDPGRPVLPNGAYRMLRHHVPSGKSSTSASQSDWPMDEEAPASLPKDNAASKQAKAEPLPKRTVAKKTARKPAVKGKETPPISSKAPISGQPKASGSGTATAGFAPKPLKVPTIVKTKPAPDYGLPSTGDPIRDAMLRAAQEQAVYNKTLPAAKNGSTRPVSNSQPPVSVKPKPVVKTTPVASTSRSQISAASAKSIAKAEAVVADDSADIAIWLRSVHEEVPDFVIAAVKDSGLTKERILKMPVARWERCCDSMLKDRISHDLELFMLKDTVSTCLRDFDAL